MSVVCDATAGDVLCGNVFDRLTGDIGTDVDEGAGAAVGGTGGEMGVGEAIVMKFYALRRERGRFAGLCEVKIGRKLCMYVEVRICEDRRRGRRNSAPSYADCPQVRTSSTRLRLKKQMQPADLRCGQTRLRSA